ncbi:MAG: T9SS type A sorting domain-containing protein [bacterium]|nr:T9SS type A sorting domain-containing protein [bacterium]
MKFFLPLLITCLFTPLFAADSASASARLRVDMTISVPGLIDSVETVVFGDIDGDDYPEVLVSDGESILLYQPSTGEVFFHHKLDSLADSFEIEGTYGRNLVGLGMVLDDVNRDSLTDAVIVLGLPGDYLQSGGGYGFLFYDDVAAANPPSAWKIQSTPHDGLGVLKAVDFNNDGYNELILASDTAVYHGDSLGQGKFAQGQTRFYHSFPDSISSELPVRITDFSSRGFQFGDVLYPATVSWTTWRRLYDGPNINRTVGELHLINDEGLPAAGVSGVREEMCSGDHHCIYVDDLRFECVGDIDPWLDGPAILTSTLWRQFCMDFGCCGPVPNFDSSGMDLCLYRAHRPDSLEEIWRVDISGSDFQDFFYHSLFPGQFFALWGNELVLFDGSNGSLIEFYQVLPEGRKYMDQPFAGSEDCLIVLDSNRISILSFDVATDAPSEREDALPSTFTLHDPYPNPFNALASVYLSLPEKTHLTVEVFNSVGQRVDRLFEGPAEAGELRLTWDADRFASGVYLVKATAGTSSHTVKALLLK